MRHVLRCHVEEWDPDRRAYRTWSPGCTCGWRGDPVSQRRLVRRLWLAHVDAMREVAARADLR